ncbi:hypothetical protein GCM10026983_24690 [Gracilibacillus alcaliphilus]
MAFNLRRQSIQIPERLDRGGFIQLQKGYCFLSMKGLPLDLVYVKQESWNVR